MICYSHINAEHKLLPIAMALPQACFLWSVNIKYETGSSHEGGNQLKKVTVAWKLHLSYPTTAYKKATFFSQRMSQINAFLCHFILFTLKNRSTIAFFFSIIIMLLYSQNLIRTHTH